MKERSLLGSLVHFATPQEGRTKIATSDVYTQRLSRYELQAKVRTRGAPAETDYLDACREHVRRWKGEEEEYLGQILTRTDEAIRRLELTVALPHEIWIVKTTGWEEGGASGYTRENVIYLNERALSERLFVHELFHIASRTSPKMASRAYATLGFEEVGEILYDDPLRISNPDAPFLRHVVTVTHRGVPCSVAPVLRGKGPYGGGSFFRYATKKLLVIKQGESNCVPQPREGGPMLLDFQEVSGFYDKIGRNTNYNIHQEEVTAVHFEHLILGQRGLPHQHLIEHLCEVLHG